MHLTLSESALAALKAMNQTGDAPDFPIEGNITGLLNFNSADPVTQVNALNLKLSTDAGWLNNLLKIEDMPTAPIEASKAVTGSDWDQTPKSGDDGWGTSSAPTSTSKPSTQSTTPVSNDGWGSSTTSSNDDWGTTGNSGGSSSKNDDW